MTLAKQAIASIEKELKTITAEGVNYYVPKAWRMPVVKDAVHLLPAFDEYLISYKDRSAAIDPKHYKQTISSNGIFWPTVVVNGKIEGLWKRTVKGGKVKIEANLFGKLNKTVMQQIEAEKERLATFLELQLIL